MFANYVNGRYIKNSKSRNMTMVGLLKWVSHGSVYVNVIRKSNNSANNSSHGHGIPTKYRLGLWLRSHKKQDLVFSVKLQFGKA